MRRGSISWRRWGERDRSVTRGFDATGNCVLDAEFHVTEGSVVEGDGKARECDFDAEARRRGDQRGDAEISAEKREVKARNAETAEDSGLRFGADWFRRSKHREGSASCARMDKLEAYPTRRCSISSRLRPFVSGTQRLTKTKPAKQMAA